MAIFGRRQPHAPIINKGLPYIPQPPVGRIVSATFASQAAAQRFYHPPVHSGAIHGLPYIPQRPVGRIVSVTFASQASAQRYYHPIVRAGALRGLPAPVGNVVTAAGAFASQAAAQRLYHPLVRAGAIQGLPYIPQRPIGRLITAAGAFEANAAVQQFFRWFGKTTKLNDIPIGLPPPMPPVGKIVFAAGAFEAQARAQIAFHPPTIAKTLHGLPYIPQKPVAKIVSVTSTSRSNALLYYHPSFPPHFKPAPIIGTRFTWVQGNQTTVGGATQFPENFTNPVTVGNLVIVAVMTNGNSGALSCADNQGNNYTAGSVVSFGTGSRVQYFWTIIGTGGSVTVTVTAANNSNADIHLNEYKVPAGTLQDGVSVNNASSATATVTMPTLSGTPELAFAFVGVEGGSLAFGAPGGAWKTRGTTTDETVADQVIATGGSGPSWGLSGSAAWAAIAVSFTVPSTAGLWFPFPRIYGWPNLEGPTAPMEWLLRRRDEWVPVYEERRPRHVDALWPSNVLPPLIQDSSGVLPGTGTSFTVKFNYPTLGGSGIVVQVSYILGPAPPTITDDQGNPYFQAALGISGNGSAIFWTASAKAGTQTVTIKFANPSGAVAAISEVAGLIGLDSHNQSSAFSGTPTSGIATSNLPLEVAFAGINVRSSFIPAVPDGWHGITGTLFNGITNAGQFSYLPIYAAGVYSATWRTNIAFSYGATIATFTLFQWQPFPRRVMPPPPDDEPQTPKKVSAALLPGFSYATPWQPFGKKTMEGPPDPEPPPTHRVSAVLLPGFNPPIASPWLPRRKESPGPPDEILPPVQAVLNAFLRAGFTGPPPPPVPWFPTSSRYFAPPDEPVISQGLSEPLKRILSPALIPVFLSGSPSLQLSAPIVPRLPQGEDPSRRLARITEVVSQILNSLIRRGQLAMDNKGNWYVQTISNTSGFAPQPSQPAGLPPLGQLWMDALGKLHFLDPFGNDQLVDVGQPLGCFVVRTPTQSINDSTTTAVSWDSPATRDDNNFFSASQPTRVTARIAGWYMVTEHVKWASNTSGKRVIDIRVNGTVFNGSNSIGPTAGEPDPDQTTAALLFLAVGDYVETTVYQNSGGALNVTAAQLQISQLV